MSHKITVTLSQTAQREALVSGEDGSKTQTYMVERELLSDLLDLPWAEVGPDGSVSCVVPLEHYVTTDDVGAGKKVSWPGSGGGGEIVKWNLPLPPCSSRPASADEAIGYAAQLVDVADQQVAEVVQEQAERRKKEAEKEAEKEARQRRRALAWAQRPLLGRASNFGLLRCTKFCNEEEDGSGELCVHGVSWVSLEALETHCPEALAEARAEVGRLQAVREQEKKAALEAEQARDALVTALVDAHGTESERQRHAEGILPRQDLFELLNRVYLPPPPDGLVAYRRITCGEITCGCYEPEISCEVTDDPDLGDAAYTHLQQARKLSGTLSARHDAAYQVYSRLHTCCCERCGEGDVSRWGVLLRCVLLEPVGSVPGLSLSVEWMPEPEVDA